MSVRTYAKVQVFLIEFSLKATKKFLKSCIMSYEKLVKLAIISAVLFVIGLILNVLTKNKLDGNCMSCRSFVSLSLTAYLESFMLNYNVIC